MNTASLYKLIPVPVLAAMLCACGGGGSLGADPVDPPPAQSVIPGGAAQTPIPVPTAQQAVPAPLPTDMVLLKHLYRDEVLAGLDLDAAQPSPNGDVEVRTFLGLYQSIDRDDNGDFSIPLEDNGLAYFRVVNRKPNGAERVHLFHGVPAGRYVTMDSTDIEVDAAQDNGASCVSIDIRLTEMDENADGRYLVNGNVVTSVLRENTRGIIEDVSVCPQTNSEHYLVFVAEDQSGSVNYGFNFYAELEEQALVEISLSETARMAPWSSNIPVDAGVSVSVRSESWGNQRLFSSAVGAEQLVTVGQLPMFDVLPSDAVYVSSSRVEAERGLVNHRREFAPDSTDLMLDLKDIHLSGVSLGPTELSWTLNSQDLPQAVSGVIFNDDLTQTYAFLSMDPDVIDEGQLAIPLEDINLIFDSTLVTLGGFATVPGGNNAFITSAGIYAGFFADANWTGERSDQDFAITADTSELLEIALELLLEGLDEDATSP